MSGELEYVNRVPEGYDGPRCSVKPKSARGFMCGLPAWEGAPEDEPRCEFHSAAKPKDIRKRLKKAVAAGANLRKANLAGEKLTWANLFDAKLPDANLSGADLCDADLPGAKLWNADLSGTALSGASLSGAELSNANLSGAELYGANLSGADLRGARFLVLQTDGVGRPPDLRWTDLRGARLSGVTIVPETIFEDAEFGRCPLGSNEHRIYDELLAQRREGDAPDYADCAQVYRQLKLAFQQSGNYTVAGEWYLAEMRCLRQQMVADKQPRGARMWWWLMEKAAGYGERPWNVAKTMAGVIAVCGLLQGWLGIEWMKWDAALRQQVPDGIGGFAWPSWSGFLRFLNALYFSLITFTTTGYGDLHPANGWGRCVASLEALSGVLLTSLLLVCIVRKFSR